MPFAPGAANGGQIASSEAVLKLRAAFDAHPILKERFGGMFGWDETWDHKQNGASPYARELARELASPNFLALVGATDAGVIANRVCKGVAGVDAETIETKSLGGGPTIASLAALVAPEPNSVVYYGRDYTNGGMAVSLADGGTEWQPYCGCTRVGFRTAFTSALECADEWAAQPVSGCAAPPATGALAQVAPTPAADAIPERKSSSRHARK